MKEVFD